MVGDAVYTAEYESTYIGPDIEKVQAFKDAYNAITTSSMENQYDTIVNAIKIYNGLGEKEKQAVSSEYNQLVEMVNTYNAKVDEVTEEHANALSIVAELLGALAGLAALAYVAEKRI